MKGNIATGSRSRLAMGAATIAALIGLSVASRSAAQGLVYVEGVDQLGGAAQNIFRADGGDINTRSTPTTANGSVPGNNLWNYRDEGVPDPKAASPPSMNPSRRIRPSSASRLAGSRQYQLRRLRRVLVGRQHNWGVRAGFASNPNLNTLFNVTGANFGTAGTLAGSGA